jgi:hypothetical protein
MFGTLLFLFFPFPFTLIVKLNVKKEFDGTVARLPMVLGGDHGHWSMYYAQVNIETKEG